MSPPEFLPLSSKSERETIEKLATVDAKMQVARVGVLYEKLIENSKLIIGILKTHTCCNGTYICLYALRQ
jgi:hypothetical protein